MAMKSPVDKEEAKVFWERKLADAELYASTNHLSMMNGCDHQPLQKDVTQAIKVANELYDDYEFIHSSFEEYLEAVMTDLPDNLSTVEGELTSQETDGWYTLANTSSSRIYLKQKKYRSATSIRKHCRAFSYYGKPSVRSLSTR